MNTAIRAASETLRSVLQDAMAADPDLRLLFTGAGASIVSLANPDEMTAAGESGISLWLYQIVRDEQRLNAPPERIAPDRIRPTPLPLRLHYLISPVIGIDGAGAPIETRHHILGAVLQTFHEQPLISGVQLTGDFSGTSVELAARLESPDLESLARLWDSLEAGYQLSLSYEVGIVSIAQVAPDGFGPPVTIALPEYGTASRLVTP
jgi:hypothetical protein